MSKSRQKKGPAAIEPASSKPETSASITNTPSEQLDDSDEGRPFVLKDQDPPLAASGQEELIVEVELVPTASHLARAIVSDTSKFLDGAESLGSTADTFAGVLRGYGMAQARPVFTEEHIKEEDERTNKLREDVALGAASIDDLGSIERLPPLSSFIRLSFPAGTVESEVIDSLNRLPEVTRAVKVPRAAPPIATVEDLNNLTNGLADSVGPVPEDPLIGTDGSDPSAPQGSQIQRQWYLHRTRIPQAWPFSRGSGVVIADIDWGFRTSHQEFEGAIERTYNAVDGSEDVTHGDKVSHGTAVLGLAAARAGEDGIAGCAPEATLWAIQGNSSVNPQRFEDPWAEAINFVRRTNVGKPRVIILEVQTASCGNYEQIPSVNREIRAAIADGCVVCVAAGNGNRPVDRTDAGDLFEPTGSILIGATAFHATQNKRADFSNFGDRVVVSAPGDLDHDVTCGKSSDQSYRNRFGGTSGAAPKVAGTVALMLSVNPKLKHHEIREILAGTGSPMVEDPGKPIGSFLNAEAAVAEAIRRRIESGPIGFDNAEAPMLPALPLDARPLHGVRRRKSERVLPRKDGSDVRGWETVIESEDTEAAEVPLADPGAQPPPGDKTLSLFRRTICGTLTQQDRILIVDQAIRMLDNFYVHRPLKEAMHAVRPIQRLRVLQRRLQREKTISPNEQDELTFHNTITQIFNSVRDLHTGYQLPRPYRDYFAYLPFEVAPFYEGEQRRYLVTRVLAGYTFASPEFGPGAELVYWNGMSIERAVSANAEQTAGSNEAARHARGVSALTLRAMNSALPPDADFVELEFVPLGAHANDPSMRRSLRQHWFVRYAPRISPSAALWQAKRANANNALTATLGFDLGTDAVREARQLIFESSARQEASRARIGEEILASLGSASPGFVEDRLDHAEIPVTSPWNAAFRARTVRIDGQDFGHVQISTFNVDDPAGFVTEFVRLLKQMPQRGLILDVRGNGGGSILAAERILQTLTPAEIDPERTQFIVSPGTLDLSRNNPEKSETPLHLWLPSLEEAVETGAVYSHAFPLTTKKSCNEIGQKYYGPVLLIVDGNCYSATDMFTAGFKDHKIGTILGVSGNTGAGGANVWTHSLLTRTLPSGWGLKPLPGQANMRVAIRQCVRVGPNAGALLEDFGVVPDAVHRPTRADVMEGDRDLFARAADLLEDQTARLIEVLVGEADEADPEKLRLEIRTIGLRRLDVYLNGRPQDSMNLELNAAGEATVPASAPEGDLLVLTGFAEPTDEKPSALYRGLVAR